MAQANTLGGGGCPAYDILIEDLPFDFLQPPMVRGLTQAGYGGPFVVRNNPIGAVFDAVRAFCFPVPMQSSADGTQYTDLSGSGLDTYGGYTSQDLGSLGGGYYGLGNNPYAPVSGYCGTGTTFDAASQMCVPTPTTPGTTTPMAMTTDCVTSCDASCLDYYSSKASDACTMFDSVTLGAIAVKAAACAAAAGSNKTLAASWTQLAYDCTRWAQYLGSGKQCNGNPKPAATPEMSSTPPAMSPSGSMPATTPTPPAGGNPMDSNNGGPFGYITAATPSSLSSSLSSSSSAGTATVVKNAARRLPSPPNPMTMTEGNINLQPSAEVMGGSFDPARIEGGRLNRPRSFSARMLGLGYRL
jgi:hypothetical protein